LASFHLFSRLLFIVSLFVLFRGDLLNVELIIILNLLSWLVSTIVVLFGLTPSFSNLKENLNTIKEKNKSLHNQNAPIPSLMESTDSICPDCGEDHYYMEYVYGMLFNAIEASTEDVCPDCGSQEEGELAVKRMRSGSRLVGCTRYPECGYTLPFPREGEIEVRPQGDCYAWIEKTVQRRK
jgi:predicted RNA-binding Zn-ribbon protein involved in translation (DUF1610 family)